MKRRMRFITWCKKDTNDERRINYTFTDCEGTTHTFTSDQAVSETPLTMERLQNSWVRNIELINNEWYAELYED